MNTYALGLASCLILMNISACTQAPPLPPGSTTYSPYSAQQMKGFNNQTLSPVEGPFGPVDPRAEDLRLSKERALDSKYYSQPVGEQEAEAQETQSAAPFMPLPSTIAF